MTANVYGLPFQSAENALEFDSGDGFIICEYTKITSELRTL